MKTSIHVVNRSLMPQPTGLGDAVAVVAKPVAEIIDRIMGTQLKACASCEERRKLWNQKMPDIKKALE